ncbi:hypothetical protein C0J52_15756 [Blattella germanica]|nr:hypothetical protein C0J52_15756 [Blattella germanica]
MKYENIKKCCKRKFADEKQELYKTGGGTPVATKITPVDCMIKEMIGECDTGLVPVLDSDDVPTPSHNWATWNPVALKEPISEALVADVVIEEFENAEAEDPVVTGLPNRDTVRRLVNRFRETGSVLDKKPKVTKRALTEEKIHQIGERLEQTPTTTRTRNRCFEGVSFASYEALRFEAIQNNCSA